MPSVTSPNNGDATGTDVSSVSSPGTEMSIEPGTATSLDTFIDYFGEEYTDYNFGQVVASAYNMSVADFNHTTAWTPDQDMLSAIYN